MSKINRRNYKIELDETLFQFVEKAAEEGKMSPLRYIQSLIEKAMYTSETKELEWESWSRGNDEVMYSMTDKLLFTIDWNSDPWFRDHRGGLIELRIHKFDLDELLKAPKMDNRIIPHGEFITMLQFESSGRAIQYAQKYAELYDLEVER